MIISSRLYMLAFLLFSVITCHATHKNNYEIDQLLSEWIRETNDIKDSYNHLNNPIYFRLTAISNELLVKEATVEKKISLLIEKDLLKEQLQQNKISEINDISKIRYLKGLQIIKILYGKTLALDHHFATVSTLNEINKISNPNNYQEFSNIKEFIAKKSEKKQGFDLSEILGTNIYTSIIHSFVSLFTNSAATKQEKDSSIRNIECILDFTLRMHNDLNTIYFETVFLKKSNENMMQEIEKLFTDYTKPIDYKKSLKDCRDMDDWDAVRDQLNSYLEKMEAAISSKPSDSKVQRMRIDLEFPIDRLLQYITQYNAFIDQGSKFYEKFGIMLDSYENEQQCSSKIPPEYNTLKKGVTIAIEKFNTAYKPVEINGSKMKEVLYGINEYE
ncbi:hypothetical protein ACFQO1_06200 [Jejudonia soesokkakensis]|uniref:Lipoprotein n=1 Tax=Jejudonia soesokkakensis TaxID=1323432 RepID=A0ABW2MUM3_9FLAO